MDLSLLALGGLAAAMALDASPDPVPAAPSETPVSCEDASLSKEDRAKAKCSRDPNEVDGLTIEGAKRGDTEGLLEPELELDEEAIRTLGANTLGELMAKLAPVLANARGRSDEPPVILINGQRTTGNMSDIPTEAILRVAPLREEEALAHGYRADQLVMNVILKKRFNATTVTNEGQWLAQGGRASSDQLLNLFKVQGEGRTLATARYHRDSPLFEDERGAVRTPVAGSAEALADQVLGGGLTAARTLMPRTEQAKLEVTHTRPLRGGTIATLGGDLQVGSSVRFRGLPGVALDPPGDLDVYRYIDAPEALKVRNDTRKIGVVAGLSGRKTHWRWNLDGGVDRSESASRIGRGLNTTALRAAVAAGELDPTAAIPDGLIRYVPRDTADSVATSAKLDMTLNGTLAGLPAGRMRAMVRLGADHRRFDSESVRSGVRVDQVLTRDRAALQTSLDMPLVDKAGPLAFLGKLSLNANGQYEQFSDIGGLLTAGGGVNWTPVKGLNLSADYGWEEGEPTPQQLNDPVQQTAATPVYDYATGQTAFVTLTSGGNPNLRSDSRQLVKLGVNYKPFETRDLRLSTNYVRTRIDDPIAGFPSASAELEAAFPSRFTRDAQGRLTAIDTRSVNFAHADTEDLRSRVTYVRRWGGPKPGTGPKSVFIALNDRWRLRDEVTIREGMAPLDKLKGASLGQFNASPRHEINLSVNLGVPGYTFTAAGFWRSPTRVDGGARGQDLRFSTPPILILMSTVDLGANKALAKDRPWLKGTKLNLSLENVFDSYMHVRDSQGRTPEAYQEALVKTGGGRGVRLGLRKQF
ncbi:hypothetical protein [Caulobacter segnis]